MAKGQVDKKFRRRKKKFSSLNRNSKTCTQAQNENKKNIYQLIINLPFHNYPSDFEEAIEQIKNSEIIMNNSDLKAFFDLIYADLLGLFRPNINFQAHN